MGNDMLQTQFLNLPMPKCPHCGVELPPIHRLYTDEELKFAWAARNRSKRTASRGIFWAHHNEKTTRCRCYFCMAARADAVGMNLRDYVTDLYEVDPSQAAEVGKLVDREIEKAKDHVKPPRVKVQRVNQVEKRTAPAGEVEE
jgi:hypothetical protein